MNNYLKLAPKYLSANKRKTRLAIFSVVLAVTLVVGIFSVLDSEVKFEKARVLRDEGNYHILIHKPSSKEIEFIKNRIDVKSSGSLKDLGQGEVNDERCQLGYLDVNLAENLNFNLVEGSYSRKANEVMLEKWFVNKAKPVLKKGDTVRLKLSNGKTGEFIVSGIYSDLAATKAAGIPIVLMSSEAASGLKAVTHDYFILFRKGVSVIKAENEIKKALNIDDKRIARNDALLALTLQSRNSRVLEMYLLGAVLFFLVLITGIVMIYNAFNISVLERVRQFGMLRCIGASPKQVKRLVRREGLSIAIRAIPIGVILGTVLSSGCSIVLKYFNKSLFGNMSIINFSLIGVTAGIVMGFLTVYIASLLPAKKAAKVSPLSALQMNSDNSGLKKKKFGLLMKVFHAQIAIGINSALNKKKTILLMACSIAFSIALFMAFSALVKPEYLGMSAIKAYTADLSLTSKSGIDGDKQNKISEIQGIKRTYGRMESFVDAAFDASRISDLYINKVGSVKKDKNGFIATPEKSLLLSYNDIQMEWAKKYLSSGKIGVDELNAQKGVIAVEKVWRDHSLLQTSRLHVGDKVKIKTVKGIEEFTVVGVCNSIPYTTDDPTLSTFVTTEKLFTEITGKNLYNALDIQLKGKDRVKTVNEIKSIVGDDLKLLDKRQLNSQAFSAFMTSAVFIYGFVGIIALISILNIINTMNTSIATKTKYIGVMRALGMSGGQLSGMIISEAIIYCLSGCIAGCTLGVMLQKALINFLRGDWRFPLTQVAAIFIVCILTAVISVLRPLARIRKRGISETIAAL